MASQQSCDVKWANLHTSWGAVQTKWILNLILQHYDWVIQVQQFPAYSPISFYILFAIWLANKWEAEDIQKELFKTWRVFRAVAQLEKNELVIFFGNASFAATVIYYNASVILNYYQFASNMHSMDQAHTYYAWEINPYKFKIYFYSQFVLQLFSNYMKVLSVMQQSIHFTFLGNMILILKTKAVLLLLEQKIKNTTRKYSLI